MIELLCDPVERRPPEEVEQRSDNLDVCISCWTLTAEASIATQLEQKAYDCIIEDNSDAEAMAIRLCPRIKVFVARN